MLRLIFLSKVFSVHHGDVTFPAGFQTCYAVKQGWFSFLTFVVPSVACFVSLHLPPQFLKKVELILANSSRLTKISYLH